MAESEQLRTCPGCGKMVTREALLCPQCEYPVVRSIQQDGGRFWDAGTVGPLFKLFAVLLLGACVLAFILVWTVRIPESLALLLTGLLAMCAVVAPPAFWGLGELLLLLYDMERNSERQVSLLQQLVKSRAEGDTEE